MEAKDNSFKSITNNELKLIIPFFQRPYVWSESHWERLFDDLKICFEEHIVPFLGSIILKRSKGRENFSYVIDGQQRLTTFSILLKVLLDKIEDDKKVLDYKPSLIESFSTDNPKIQHSLLDREKYSQLIKENKIQENEKTGIMGCYNYFKKRVGQHFENQDEILNFTSFVVSNKSLVVVYLDADEDEQKIFDSINSTGEKLTATDIIKNSLFDKIIKEYGEDETIKLYNDYWKDIFEKNDETYNFWNETIATGRIQRIRSEIFLHAFSLIKGFFDPTKHNLEQLSSLYKDKIKLFDKTKIKNLLDELKLYAELYTQLPEIDNDYLFHIDKYEGRLFHIFKVFDINTALSIVLLLKNKFKNQDEELKKCFYLIENFILYRAICREHTDGYNKLFAKITQEIVKENDIIIIYNYIFKELVQYGIPHKDRVIEKFGNINNKHATFVLFWIELFRQSANQMQDITIGLQYVYQLEHLMPKEWKAHWNIGKDEEYMKSLIYQIGNMTLLKGKLNASIKNADWGTKLNGNEKKQNCISKNAGLIINKELLNKEQWGQKEIEERSQRLINDFFKIWNYDKESFEVNHEDIQLNLSLQPKTIKKRRTRTSSSPKLLSVIFPDKTEICETKVISTFIKSIEKIGFEKVMNLCLQCRNVDLISKQKQMLPFVDEHVKEYKGYFIVSNSSTEQKMRYLKEISDKLGLNLIIEEVE